MSEQRDPIECLLNAMEHAAQSGNPFAAGYGGKRQAVLFAISELRAQLAAERERIAELETKLRRIHSNAEELFDTDADWANMTTRAWAQIFIDLSVPPASQEKGNG